MSTYLRLIEFVRIFLSFVHYAAFHGVVYVSLAHLQQWELRPLKRNAILVIEIVFDRDIRRGYTSLTVANVECVSSR